jgi:hypothetical protein
MHDFFPLERSFWHIQPCYIMQIGLQANFMPRNNGYIKLFQSPPLLKSKCLMHLVSDVYTSLKFKTSRVSTIFDGLLYSGVSHSLVFKELLSYFKCMLYYVNGGTSTGIHHVAYTRSVLIDTWNVSFFKIYTTQRQH